MPSERALREALESLRGLAESNAADFEREPALFKDYREALAEDRLVYTRNRESCCVTCPQPQCWSTWRSLRTVAKGGVVRADCKQLVGAHAAYLALTSCLPVWVGISPGDYVSHAVCGVEKDGRIRIIDPSVAAGMPPLDTYRPVWMQVRGNRC